MGTVTSLESYRDKAPTKKLSRVVVGLNPDDNRVYISIIGDEAIMFNLDAADAEVLGVEITKAAKRSVTT